MIQKLWRLRHLYRKMQPFLDLIWMTACFLAGTRRTFILLCLHSGSVEDDGCSFLWISKKNGSKFFTRDMYNWQGFRITESWLIWNRYVRKNYVHTNSGMSIVKALSYLADNLSSTLENKTKFFKATWNWWMKCHPAKKLPSVSYWQLALKVHMHEIL